MVLSRKTLSKNEVSQTFNLVEIFGKPIPEDLVISFGQSIIDHIIDRSSEGFDVNNNQMQSYSGSYADSLPFIARGKSKNEVNMRLRSNMMYDMDILEATPTSLKIGFKSTLENNKAYGHMTGMEGHPVLDGVTPKREFFGLNDSDIEGIASPIASQLPAEEDDTKESILGNLTFARPEKSQRVMTVLDVLEDLGLEDLFD